jgi:hypothetical protein
MAVSVAGLALCGGTKHRRDVVESLDIRLGREIKIATVCLRLAGECVLEVFLGLGSIQFHGSNLRNVKEFRLILMRRNLCALPMPVNGPGSGSGGGGVVLVWLDGR